MKHGARIFLGVAFLTVLFAIIALLILGPSTSDVTTGKGVPTHSTSTLTPPSFSAFQKSSGGRLAPLSPTTAEKSVTAPPASSSHEYETLSLPALKEKLMTAFPPSPAPQEVLSLPPVSDSELAIEASGLTTPETYITYFVAHSGEVRFDSKRFRLVLKNTDNVEILPVNLISQALDYGSFEPVRDSLSVWKDFISAKIVFMKGIKIYGDAIPMQKRMLGFDMLTLSLIENVFRVERGEMTRADFEEFFRKFRATARKENGEIGRQFQIAWFEKHGNFWERMFAWLGVPPVSALNPPLGVTLGQPLACTCENAYWIPVTGPVAPPIGSIWVPMTFLSSPLYYDNQTMRAGAWWLGLYSQGIQTCKDASDECTGVWRQGAPIFMTGTSN